MQWGENTRRTKKGGSVDFVGAQERNQWTADTIESVRGEVPRAHQQRSLQARNPVALV
jgi:hypothetical protein